MGECATEKALLVQIVSSSLLSQGCFSCIVIFPISGEEGLLRAQSRGGVWFWAVSHHRGVHLGGPVSQPYYSPSPFLRIRILPEIPLGLDFPWAKYHGAVGSMPLEARSGAAGRASGELGNVQLCLLRKTESDVEQR